VHSPPSVQQVRYENGFCLLIRMFVETTKCRKLLMRNVASACGAAAFPFLPGYRLQIQIQTILSAPFNPSSFLANSTIFVTSEHLGKMRKLLPTPNVSTSRNVPKRRWSWPNGGAAPAPQFVTIRSTASPAVAKSKSLSSGCNPRGRCRCRLTPPHFLPLTIICTAVATSQESG